MVRRAELIGDGVESGADWWTEFVSSSRTTREGECASGTKRLLPYEFILRLCIYFYFFFSIRKKRRPMMLPGGGLNKDLSKVAGSSPQPLLTTSH